MTPIKHPLCNDILRKPEGMTEEECGDLHIRRDNGSVCSFWKPSAEELVALNAGGALALVVCGSTHPPISMQVTRPTEARVGNIDATEYRHRMEALNGRLSALVALTKRVIALLVATSIDSGERRKLVDVFLDMLNSNRTDGSFLPSPSPVSESSNAVEITAIKNRLAMAEAALNTERELSDKLAQNLKNLLHYVHGREGHVPVSGNAVLVRDALINLRYRGDHLQSVIDTVIDQLNRASVAKQ